MIQSAQQITISALLSKNNEGKEFQYLIPPYQREYAWNKNQWDNLFDDLTENDKGYFLGSMICILGEQDEATVIDGQQRLTTLNLLLLAIYEKLENIISNPNNSDKKDIIFNNRTYNKYWLELADFLLHDETSRLIPSIQNNNKSDFDYLVRKTVKGDDSSKPANFGNRRISKAFNHFSERIENYVADSVETLFALLEKVISACVVRIDTKDEASAFILFESINNRGVPLTPMDLIKNTMISSLSSGSTNSAEETNIKWQNIVNNLNDYDVQVRYLRHFYQAFRLISLIFDADKGKEKITKNDLIQIYTNAIKKQPKKVLDELIAKSEIYKLLSLPEDMAIDSGNDFSKYQKKLIDLKKLGISSAYTLLLFLFSHYPKQNFDNLLNYLEKWFMARHLTNTPASNRLDELFISATKTQLKAYDEKRLIAILQKEMSQQERIREALDSITLYEDNSALVRYILIYLEQSQRTAENQVDFWAVNNKGRPIWSVEYIYPQNPKTNEWSNDCKDGLHALGNLTLTAYNSNLSNRSFDKKAKVKDENGNDIGLKSGNVKINDYLQDKDDWGLDDIKNRSKQLKEVFLKNYLFDDTAP